MSGQNADFRGRLRQHRESLGLSQAEAGARVGATATQWGSWERHNITAEPNMAMLRAIAGEYDLSIHWLLTGAGPKRASALVAGAGEGGPAPSDIERFVKLLSSDQLRELAEQRARAERAMLEGPLADAISELRRLIDAGEAPAARVREMLNRMLGEEQAQRVVLTEPPVQREGYVEEVEREYDARPPSGGNKPSKRRTKEG